MTHTPPSSRNFNAGAILLAVLASAATSGAAWAQQPAGTPQQRYEQQLARCNSGTLPEPARDACVRDAGRMLDQALGGTPGNVTTTTQDGRATVVNPAGLPVPNSGSDDVTSRDGRATIVVPADQQPPK